MQRAPGQHAEAVAQAGGQHLKLDRAGREVVQGLLADQPERTVAAGRLLRLGDVPASEVRRPGIDDLALGAKDRHRLPDLVPRGVPVHVVHLVQIDAVRPQPPQRVVAGLADVHGGQEAVVRPLPLAAVQLRGQDHHVPAPGPGPEPVPDDLLADTLGPRAAVGVRGVEEVDPLLEREVHDPVRLGHVSERAEVHGAETEPADRDAAAPKMRVVHAANLRPATARGLAQADPRQAVPDQEIPG